MALGFANLAVTILNHHYFRERPFAVYELSNLLYQATDSSFPANPTAIAFGAATGGLAGAPQGRPDVVWPGSRLGTGQGLQWPFLSN